MPDNKKIDATITKLAKNLLWNDTVIRSTDYHDFDICAKDQVVYLRGHVLNVKSQQHIENIVRAVPGVLVVISSLILDDNLKRDVTEALEGLEDNGNGRFDNEVRHGVVTLYGEISNVTLRSLAEKCVANISGVRGVLNEVRTLGDEPILEENRFIQPLIGEQIYLRDGPSGVVLQVIMNPNNRLVIAFVIQEHSSDHETTPQATKLEDIAPGKKLVISTGKIRYLSHHAGYPQPRGDAPEPYKDFESSNFIIPNKNWIPPYPYVLGDVLFPAEGL